VLPYPPRRGVVRAGQATGQGDGRCVECGASPPYGPERPANTLLDEVALVGGRALDERKGPEERTVSGLLVMERQAGQKGKGGPLHDLVPPPAPGCNLPPRVRRPVEEAEADGVAHTPVVEVPRPAVHLERRDPLRLGDVRRKQASFVPARVPQRRCE